MSKRRSPSKTWPTVLPPMATSIVSCTSATLSPSRAISDRLSWMVRRGSPVVCSTLLSAAPGTAASAASIRVPTSPSTSMSSPNTFTATSLRTPAMSSLKRIWIGWMNS